MKKLLLTLLCPFFLSAQQYHEFLVRVNTSTGNLIRIDSLKGINYKRIQPPAVTIDKTNNRFYFVGLNSSSVQSLYSANMTTGKIRNHGLSPMSGNGLFNIGHYEFDDSTGNIYGIATNSSNKTVFLRVDTSSAQVTTLTVFQNLNSYPLRNYTYDQDKHRYIFTGSDGSNHHLVVINALTGSLLSSVQITNSPYPFYIRYNNNTSTLYALFSSGNGNVTVASMDMSTGLALQTVTTIPNTTLVTMGFSPNRVSLDELNNRLTFIEPKANPKILTIDLSNGNIISNPTFTTALTAQENVAEIRYNPADGNLYALHWGLKTISNEPTTSIETESAFINETFIVAPNPSNGSIIVIVKDVDEASGLRLFDLTGKLVLSLKKNSIMPSTHIADLAPGFYIVELQTGGKMVKQRVLVESK